MPCALPCLASFQTSAAKDRIGGSGPPSNRSCPVEWRPLEKHATQSEDRVLLCPALGLFVLVCRRCLSGSHHEATPPCPTRPGLYTASHSTEVTEGITSCRRPHRIPASLPLSSLAFRDRADPMNRLESRSTRVSNNTRSRIDIPPKTHLKLDMPFKSKAGPFLRSHLV